MATSDSTVEYQDIQGFPGYRVGDDGSVWSLWKVGGGSHKPRPREMGSHWRKLKCGLQDNGYPRVALRNKNGVSYKLVHRLVLEAFHGPAPVGTEGCHKDGDRTNSRSNNLRWDTRQGNVNDTVRMGRNARGNSHGCSILTEEVVRLTKRKLRTGNYRVVDLAKELGVSTATVYAIRSGARWGWLE